MKRADRKRHHKKIKSLQETAYLLRSHANAKRLLAAIDSLKPAVKPARSNCEKRRSIPRRLHPEPDDPVDQLRIRQARLARRLREVFVVREMGIRVGLNEIDLVLHRQPQVDAR